MAAVDAVALLDTPPEAAFDGLVLLAARCTGAPAAYMSLVTDDRQFFKSAYNLPPALAGLCETPLSHSICRYVVEIGAPLVLEDARAHPLTRENGAVREHGVVAYAGIPLCDEQGHVLGAVCAIDQSPRAWDAEALAALERVAFAVATEIGLRRQLAERVRAEAQLRASSARLRLSEARFRAFVEQSSDAVFVLDHQARFTYVSPSSERVLGYAPAAVTGMSALDLLAPDDVGPVLRALVDAFEAPGTVRTARARARHADGSWRTVHASGRALAEQEGSSGEILVHLRDVSEYVAAMDALRRSEERYRTLSASAPVGVFERDRSGAVTYANARAEELWQLPAEALMGAGWLQRVHPDDRTRVIEVGRAALAAGQEYEHEYRLLFPNGETRWVYCRAAPLRDDRGDLVGMVGTLADVTARRLAAEELAASEERLRQALGAAHMVAWEVDVRTTPCDPSGREAMPLRFAGPHTQATETYASFLATVHADDRGRVHAAASRALSELVGFEEEFRVVEPDGRVTWRHAKGRAVLDATGAPDRMIGVALDVTPRKTLEAELRHRSFHDSLTGLANRVLFRQRVDSALESSVIPAGSAHATAVLFLDLDDFKRVNDSLGHDAGDRLLVLIAERLAQVTRGCDVVARLGGDEFAILLDGLREPSEAATVADRVATALGAPFDVGSHKLRISASIGIAHAQPGDRTEDLLRNADVAMYHAKSQGKDRQETFHPAMHAAAVERLELEAALRRAIAENELELHFQPVIDLDSGAVHGAEALVRWRHPERGLLSPAAFIPLAESTELIVPLGRWVLAEACRVAAGWARPIESAAPPLSVAVNVSGRQLQCPSFVEEVAEALRTSGLAANRLVLEMTETVLIAGSDTALERLESLRALGVRLALDDFGTGYSSLAYLQRLPVDVLKIDRSFTAGITVGGRRAALTRAIIGLAASLGLRTVAEGVETEAQQAALRALHCSCGQGYLYARPLEADAFERFCAASHTRQAPEGSDLTLDAVAAHAGGSTQSGAAAEGW